MCFGNVFQDQMCGSNLPCVNLLKISSSVTRMPRGYWLQDSVAPVHSGMVSTVCVLVCSLLLYCLTNRCGVVESVLLLCYLIKDLRLYFIDHLLCPEYKANTNIFITYLFYYRGICSLFVFSYIDVIAYFSLS